MVSETTMTMASPVAEATRLASPSLLLLLYGTPTLKYFCVVCPSKNEKNTHPKIYCCCFYDTIPVNQLRASYESTKDSCTTSSTTTKAASATSSVIIPCEEQSFLKLYIPMIIFKRSKNASVE
jgi:hypothetical protein